MSAGVKCLISGETLNRWRETAEAGQAVVDAEITRRAKARAFFDAYFAPWGAWKSEWWEGVAGDLPFTAESALVISQRLLCGPATEAVA